MSVMPAMTPPRPGGRVPSALSTVATMASVTLKRLGRGKALWTGGAIAVLPIGFAVIVRTRHSALNGKMLIPSLLLLVILPAMFIGGSIGQEFEDRTTTYLWSRPIARWAVLAGKLCALTPIVIVLIVGSWCAASTIWVGAAPTPASCGALAAGAVAASLVAAGITMVLPRHGTALTIGYLLVDLFVDAMPFSLRELSITHQTGQLAHLGSQAPITATPVIAIAAIAALWTVIGLARVRRIEA